ncbi:hypothetical protein E2F46_08605 [Luteimonas aestuarii]|uniref:Uncharacterized protein n=1 Tax=Luteimonas aestuarii TaxID=453837 RepID=A0A4R5TQ51_9GAMM|nr:hypothetical protein [Luteimonas aestuarii]TDK24339.1 hypothetical protein E2F46_08605 [Luteimonas aestuarii]
MRRPAALAALVLSTLLAAAAFPASAQSPVRLEVVDRDTGQWMPEYRHRRDTWIAGMPGHRYGVRLTNTTGERVLVVLSVDGVNAVSGQTAHPSQAGYVLEPWQSAEVNGWRKSYSDIAQFVFTALPDSYAARTGRPDNVGTIGIAVFRERRVARPMPMPSPPIARDDSMAKSRAASPAAEAHGAVAEQQQRIGTGHGQREWSPTQGTSFVRASTQPVQLTQLRYDSPHALVAAGILPRTPQWQSSRGPRAPQAFPTGFVADPPPRRGW